MSLKSATFAGIERLAPYTPFRLARSLVGNPAFLPFYHVVSDRDLPHIKHLYRVKTTAEFERDLDFFLKHYVPVDAIDLLASIKGTSKLPPNAFLLTVDDGFRECEEIIAPVLQRKGIPAIFFVCSGFINNADLSYRNKASLLHEHFLAHDDAALRKKTLNMLRNDGIEADNIFQALHLISYAHRASLENIADLCNVSFAEFLAVEKPYMDSGQVRSLINKGFHIGAHSIDHPVYSLLPENEQFRQTLESTDVVTKEFDLDYRFFAHPFMDNGITAGYFQEVVERGQLDLIFGTSGLMTDPCRENVQRVFMERSMSFDARSEITEEMLKTLLRKATGKNTVVRAP
jgi:peptidoglycan/xylan/chitin deacetylase (PgdA/CDA1 family)